MFWKHFLGIFSLFPMLFYSSYIMFCGTLLSTILFALGSNSLFFIWVMLEINMMSVLPLLSAKGGVFEGDTTLKYFISQSVASIIFIFSTLISFSSPLIENFISLSILFKLGVAPFHGWMMSIFLSSDLYNLFIIGVVQKVIPFHLMTLLNVSDSLIILIMIINLGLVLTLMFTQSSARMVLFLSALSNSLWILSTLNLGQDWLKFILIYSLINFNLIFFLSYLNLSSVSQLSLMPGTLKLLFSLSVFSLAGIPPFTGFALKLMMLKSLFISLKMFMSMLLIFSSLLILWVYLSIILSMYSSSESKMINFSHSTLLTASFTLLIFLPMNMLT